MGIDWARCGRLPLGWSEFGISAKEALCGKPTVHPKLLNGLCYKRVAQSAFA